MKSISKKKIFAVEFFFLVTANVVRFDGVRLIFYSWKTFGRHEKRMTVGFCKNDTMFRINFYGFRQPDESLVIEFSHPKDFNK